MPGEILGVQIKSADQIKLQLDDIIRSSLQPGIVPNVQIKEVNGFKRGPVIIIRVPQSATGPHMIWRDRKSHFYIRSSNGTSPMDVGEIRSAFAMSESIAERMKEFRAQRISKIIADDTPIALRPGPKMIIHFLPFTAFNPSSRPDYMDHIRKYFRDRVIYPARCSGLDWRYNFDGIVTYCASDGARKISDTYKQVFRSGIIEVCWDMWVGEGSGKIHFN